MYSDHPRLLRIDTKYKNCTCRKFIFGSPETDPNRYRSSETNPKRFEQIDNSKFFLRNSKKRNKNWDRQNLSFYIQYVQILVLQLIEFPLLHLPRISGRLLLHCEILKLCWNRELWRITLIGVGTLRVFFLFSSSGVLCPWWSSSVFLSKQIVEHMPKRSYQRSKVCQHLQNCEN